MMHYLPSIAGVAVLSILITRMLIPLAHAVGLLDRPLGRKVHSGAVPLVGGISIYLSVVIGSAAFLELSETFVSVALICGLVTAMGVVDDRYPLQPIYRLILQLIAGLAIAGIGIKVSMLGNLAGPGNIELGLLAIPSQQKSHRREHLEAPVILVFIKSNGHQLKTSCSAIKSIRHAI